MKNKVSQSRPRTISFLIPVAVYLFCIGMDILGKVMIMRINPWMETLVDFWTWMPVLSDVIMFLSYVFSYLYTKNKKWGYGGFSFCIVSTVICSYIIVGNWVVALWSVTLVLGSLMFGILLYMSYDWFRKLRRQKELEKQNLQSELKLLKNQLNPHFLFNTLNNIDSLIRSNPDKASVSLVQMSEMMRYMIYETNVPEVSLNQELTYIENYLNLQRLQYDNPDIVTYKLEGKTEGIRIAPMLFIPFIENAFKHCTDKKAKNAIHISFHVLVSGICFEVSDLFDISKHINKDSSNGIGLNVVKRRLELLYPDKYDLQINASGERFCVLLKIELI